MGNVGVAKDGNLPPHQTIGRHALRQGTRIPDFHPARKHLHHHATPEVGVVPVRKGVHQALSQGIVGVQPTVFPGQRTQRKHAQAGRVAADVGKHLVQDRDQRPLKIFEVPVGVVCLVVGERCATRPHLRVALGRVPAKQNIPAVGQSPVLHQTQALQRLSGTVRSLGPPIASLGALPSLNSALDFVMIQILREVGIGKTSLPTFGLHLSAHDHVAQCRHVGPPGAFTFADENLVPKTVGNVLACGNFHHPNGFASHIARLERHQGARGESFRHLLFQPTQIGLGRQPHRLPVVPHTQHQVAAARIQEGTHLLSHHRGAGFCLEFHGLAFTQVQQLRQGVQLHGLSPR